jgi:gluconokinase
MGVSGSGKTTVGRALADALGWTFFDGDDFHPERNVEKMASGQPLTDADRAPWLRAIRDFIHERLENDEPAIVACSALKEAYREVLLDGNDGARIVHLAGSYDLIRDRMEARSDHFFDAAMLQSQFDALEEPDPDAVPTISIDQPPSAIVRDIQERLSGLSAPRSDE